MAPDLSILIVSYNCAGLLRDCLYSIPRGSAQATNEIIVVDNASGDGTRAMLADEFPHVLCIANTVNVGFARANNQGLAVARGRCILYLNPDTVVLDGAFDAMLVVVEQPGVGLVGPHTYNADRTTTQYTVYNDHTLTTVFNCHIPLFKHLLPLPVSSLDTWLPAGTCPVEVVRGSCMLARADLLRDIGGMDERYFMYSEDYELCRAVRSRGYTVMYCREASIVHIEGGTTSAADRAPLAAVDHINSIRTYFLIRRPGSRLLRLRCILLAGSLWRYTAFVLIALFFPSHRVAARTTRRNYAARLHQLLFAFTDTVRTTDARGVSEI